MARFPDDDRSARTAAVMTQSHGVMTPRQPEKSIVQAQLAIGVFYWEDHQTVCW